MNVQKITVNLALQLYAVLLQLHMFFILKVS